MKKKILTRVCAMGLAAFVFMTGSVDVLANYSATVSSGPAKIRATAGTDSEVVGSAKAGATVDVIEEVSGADGYTWCKIYVNGTSTGYIRSDLITKAGGATTTTTTNTTTTNTTSTTTETKKEVPVTQVTNMDEKAAYITAGSANVREQASTDAGVVAAVKKNQTVTITGSGTGTDGKNWYQVRLDSGKVGFVREDLIKIGTPEATTTTDTSTTNNEAPAAEVEQAAE